jgi:hypothetical protein
VRHDDPKLAALAPPKGISGRPSTVLRTCLGAALRGLRALRAGRRVDRRARRRVTRKRYAGIAPRRTATGFLEAQNSFRKIQDIKGLWILKVASQRPVEQGHVDRQPKAA